MGNISSFTENVLGNILTWNRTKQQGIVQSIEVINTAGPAGVTQSRVVQKYFLQQTRISRSPEVIQVGQYVKFTAAPAPRAGLLPMALAAEVSNTPFNTADADSAKVGAL